MYSSSHIARTSSRQRARRASRGDFSFGGKALHVVEAGELEHDERARLLGRVADIYHSVWGKDTEEYGSGTAALRHLKSRTRMQQGATYVALTPDGDLAGTAAIEDDDFYDGFCLSNGVGSAWIGRDLYTVPALRGVVLDGLKVWEHLVLAQLKWVLERGGSAMTIFTEDDPIDLPSLYARVGAVVVRRGLHHRHLGPGTITMLKYPVETSLSVVSSLRRSRLAATLPPSASR